MKSLDAFMYGPKDLRLEEVEVPALRPTQILVKVHASGICGSDVELSLIHILSAEERGQLSLFHRKLRTWDLAPCNPSDCQRTY